MKEFIVWDVNESEFDDETTVVVDKDGNVRYLFTTEKYNDSLKCFPYIGLKDINNKKIYADCSIVELEIDEDFSNEHFTSTESHKFIGIVRFDYLGARVEDINDKTTVWFYEIENNEIDIKIIDNIQENKLGLIK